MKKIRLIDRIWLWVAHHFGTKKQMIPNLHSVAVQDIKTGVLYEWYGRIVKAHKNPLKVTVKYFIYPSQNMTQKAIDLIVKETDNLKINERYYETTNKEIGEALKREEGVKVQEDIINKPCDKCCMLQEGYPCPGCNFSHYWEKVAEYKQNCTNQEAWMRMMEKRVNR